jgi:hypothetical protein
MAQLERRSRASCPSAAPNTADLVASRGWSVARSCRRRAVAGVARLPASRPARRASARRLRMAGASCAVGVAGCLAPCRVGHSASVPRGHRDRVAVASGSRLRLRPGSWLRLRPGSWLRLRPGSWLRLRPGSRCPRHCLGPSGPSAATPPASCCGLGHNLIRHPRRPPAAPSEHDHSDSLLAR